MTRDKHPTHERYLVPLVMTRDKNSHVLYHYTSFFNDKRAYHDKHVRMNNIFHDEYVTFLERKANFPPPLPYPGEPQGIPNKSNTSLPDKRFLMSPNVFIVTWVSGSSRRLLEKQKYGRLLSWASHICVPSNSTFFNRIKNWLYRDNTITGKPVVCIVAHEQGCH